MRKVLVLDANQRSALAIIRSLGRHGLSIIAGDHLPGTLGAASRYAAGSVLYPHPAESASAFIAEIQRIVERLDVDTVVPATDLTTMLLAGRADFPNAAQLVTPQASSYEALTDKARLIELARRLGVPVPETRVASNPSEIEKAASQLGYPLILKPARSRYLSADRVIATSVSTVQSSGQLSAAVARLGWLEDIPCLVQRFVPGHGAGIFTLHGPQGPITWFAHRRVREKPPTGGVSTVSESVALNPALQTAALKLLSAVHWIGVAMVEFRIADDGTPYLMEVNGRFWGSLQLAIDCGVDFPWLLYQLAKGLPVPSPAPYVVGRRLRWVLGDLDSLIIELRRAGSSPAVKARAISAFLASFADPGCHPEVLRLSDLSPGAQEIRHWIRDLRGAYTR